MNNPSFAPYQPTTNPHFAPAQFAKRTGCFAARIGTSHQHKLKFAVGWAKVGQVVHDSVMDYSRQPESVKRGVKWVCTNPECAGKTWSSKEDLLVEHPDNKTLERSGAAHMFYGIGKLPADVIAIADVTNDGPTLPMTVTTEGPHGIQQRARIIISGVKGNTAANGTFLATPTGEDTFTVPRAGNGTFLQSEKGSEACVQIRPERPVLLSDEE
jgi:hypothetical protein